MRQFVYKQTIILSDTIMFVMCDDLEARRKWIHCETCSAFLCCALCITCDVGCLIIVCVCFIDSSDLRANRLTRVMWRTVKNYTNTFLSNMWVSYTHLQTIESKDCCCQTAIKQYHHYDFRSVPGQYFIAPDHVCNHFRHNQTTSLC